MNQHLKNIQDLLQQNNKLSEADKEALLKAITDADKQWSITDFKLDRTEKVKKTTAILLEETIEELEQKRKAVEAQNRELEIESALERVRARTMAMQHSEELMETSVVLFDQLKQLGEHIERTIIGVVNEEERVIDIWATRPDGSQMSMMQKFPIDEPIVLQKVYAAWRQQKKSIVIDLQGEELESYFQFLKSRGPQLKRESFGERRVENFAFFSKGMLGVISVDPTTPANVELYERFAAVFDQTYTRFLDLQKSEAQARESQIEAALERVRSRSMGMQKSEELKEVIQIVYEQFVHLNIHVEHTGFIMDYKIRDDMNIWLADKHVVPFQVTIPYFDCAHWNSFNEAKEKGMDFFANHLSFEEKNKFYQDLFKLIPGVPEETLEYYFSCPGLAISTVLLENVGLYIENFSGIPYTDEENNTLMRFGKVFQQTYTRFNDLQKAEAQAREARIENALEKVRSRTMAMQKSEDLNKAASDMFKQIQVLGMQPWACGFNIFDKDEKAVTQYMSLADGGISPAFRTPLTEDPFFINIYEVRQRREDLLVMESSGKELEETYRYMFGLPGSKEIFGDLENSGFEMPKFQITHCAYFSQGYLVFITYEHVPESHDIFKRFAKVFEQTYTRFLDLQKAEAQARESQIEAALERVRSRTMAMQKSEELADAAYVLFQQLNLLGVAHERINIGIVNQENNVIDFWITEQGGNEIRTRFTGSIFEPTTISKLYTGWKEGRRSAVVVLSGEDLSGWLNYLQEIGIPFNPAFKHDRRVQTAANFSKGMLIVTSPEPLREEAIYLLEKFAGVFDLTYTRFNDLKVAEAHTEQARLDLIQIQTEKKRAEETLAELQATQKQLIQSEKMASLGELTAGIAHEIQNPLNFVNNFSDVSNELLEEMKTELEKGNTEDAMAIVDDVKQNLEKILHHGKRADAIVKGMLQHSRSSSGVKEPTDINTLADEYLRLAFHGLRAKEKNFNAAMKTDYDETIGLIKIIPQDIGRVILNLITNAFYAVTERKKQQPDGYEPIVSVSTKRIDGRVEIKVNDNGTGMPQKVLDKIFQPFFTTKPTGQGTGLGLSLAYDIVKAHGGELKVVTKEGEGTEFIIQLPVV